MTAFYKYKVYRKALSKAEKEILDNSLFVYARLSPQELATIIVTDCETENGSSITLLVEQLNLSESELVQIDPDNL